jgi:RNA polymerase sigma-70 factor (ECF subfamily)
VLHALEKSLIRKARRGDAEAIERLIRTHQESLYGFLLRLSGRPQVAEDLVQEAFVRVLKNLDRFDDRFRFSTWLFTIARRLFVNHIQKLAPSFDSDTVGLASGVSRRPDQISADGESRANLHGVLEVALDSLSLVQREIVLLFHQQEWSIEEIARQLDMPEGTVKSHLHRARRRMLGAIRGNPTLHARAVETWNGPVDEALAAAREARS